MPDEAQPGLASGSLAVKPGVGVGGALVGVVGAALAVEIDLALAPWRGGLAGAVLRLDALH